MATTIPLPTQPDQPVAVAAEEHTTAFLFDMTPGSPVKFVSMRIRYTVDAQGSFIAFLEEAPVVRRTLDDTLTTMHPEVPALIKAISDLSDAWAQEDAAQPKS